MKGKEYDENFEFALMIRTNGKDIEFVCTGELAALQDSMEYFMMHDEHFAEVVCNAATNHHIYCNPQNRKN